MDETAAVSASFVLVTDQLPGAGPDQGTTLGVTGLPDDPVTDALAATVTRQGGVWLGRPARRPAGGRGLRLEADDVSRYHDHARQTIWPIYHDLARSAVHDARWRRAYRRVNRAFATAAAANAARGATVWVHDYHLQLVPAYLRRMRPDLRIGFFLQTGFPPMELFTHMPMRRDILNGMLGADVVGFQTAKAAENFLRLTQELLGMILPETALGSDGSTQVGVFPTSVDTSSIAALATRTDINRRAAAIRTDLGAPRFVVLSIDTADEANGSDQRLRAVGELFASGGLTPHEVVLVQLVTRPPAGDQAVAGWSDRLGGEVARVNGRFASVGWPCVHYSVAAPRLEERVALYRAADIMIATPLRAGASLPALEFVAAGRDEGALVLSEFTGTAALLPRAYLVNPHDIDHIKSGLRAAMTAPGAELRQRIRAMRAGLGDYDSHSWARSFLTALRMGDVGTPERARPSRARPSDAGPTRLARSPVVPSHLHPAGPAGSGVAREPRRGPGFTAVGRC